MTSRTATRAGRPTAEIAFERSIEGSNSEIFVMNADGSGVENLSGIPADEFEPRVSPDGESIAFVSDRDGNDESTR